MIHDEVVHSSCHVIWFSGCCPLIEFMEYLFLVLSFGIGYLMWKIYNKECWWCKGQNSKGTIIMCINILVIIALELNKNLKVSRDSNKRTSSYLAKNCWLPTLQQHWLLLASFHANTIPAEYLNLCMHKWNILSSKFVPTLAGIIVSNTNQPM